MMEEGINMGRKCPWSKEFLKSVFDKVESYSKRAAMYALQREGQRAAMDAFTAYNMFKYPVVYLYIHYHFGDFEDLGMQNPDIALYLKYLSNVKYCTHELHDGMELQTVFDFDVKNEIAPALIIICEEVLYIEENF